MSLALIIAGLLLILYTALLMGFAYGFLRLPLFKPAKAEPVFPVTIMICARNEEKTIGACIRSLRAQNYDPRKIQLLLVNDASTDATLQIAESGLAGWGVHYRIITNAQQKGKKSLTEAMAYAENELIIFRDADTYTLSKDWLITICSFYTASASDLIIAPVAIANNFGVLWALQAIETNILTVIAAGSSFYKKPFLCNGANLAFKKSMFKKTDGFASHMDLVSGDDIFFLEDVKKTPGAGIGYLKSPLACVSTYPCYSFTQLLAQKARWAAKFKNNANPINRLLAFLTLSVNACWLICFVACYFTLEYQLPCLLFVFLKLSIDLLLLFLASGFTKNRSLWWFALPVGCIYPLYACVVSVASVLTKPKWKL